MLTIAVPATWLSTSRSIPSRSASRSCPRLQAGSTSLSVASVASCTLVMFRVSLLEAVRWPASAVLAPIPIS